MLLGISLFELFIENLLQFGFLILKARLVNFVENLSNFREGVTILCHVFSNVERVLDQEVGLAKYRSAFGLDEAWVFELVLRSIGFGSGKFQLVVENTLGIEEINARSFLIELEHIKLQDLRQDINHTRFALEVIFLDKGHEHADHGIGIEAT